jgi:X-Pro dipeptidyl-peptidase (S15 family)
MQHINQKTIRKISQLSFLFIILAVILWASIFPITLSYKKRVDSYFEQENVAYEYISIPIEANKNLEAIVLKPKDFNLAPNGKIPAIIHINGINNRKEGSLGHGFNFAKVGYFVVMLESRGHGQSDGKGTLYGEEPADIPKVIDYIVNNYPAVNKTHFAGSGFSYGAGEMLIAQALDSRIYSSVLYHPPTNISALFDLFGGPDVVGKNFFKPATYAPEDIDTMDSRSPYYWCNSNNTRNLLLIQGSEDTTINPNLTYSFYDYINGSQYDDVQVIVRSGLDHAPNEQDPVSRQYALSWISHFHQNSSINISNLNTEFQYQTLYPFNLPQETWPVGDMIFYGIILMSSGLWIQFRLFLDKKKENTGVSSEKSEMSEKSEFNKTLVIGELIILISSSLIVGLLSKLMDGGTIFGLILWIPLISLILMIGLYFKFRLISLEKNQIKQKILENIFGIIAAIGPILIGTALFDWKATTTLQMPYWPWKPLLLFYVGVFILLFYWSHFLIKHIIETKKFVWLLIVAIALSVSVGVYMMFKPIPAIIPNLKYLIIFGIGIVIIFVGLIIELIKKTWGKLVPGMLFIAILIAIPLINRLHSLFV